jgi:hypothetical protein
VVTYLMIGWVSISIVPFSYDANVVGGCVAVIHFSLVEFPKVV